MENYKFDTEAFINQIKNECYLKLLETAIDNKEEANLVTEYLRVFMRYGVSADIAFNILTDLSKIKKEDK